MKNENEMRLESSFYIVTNHANGGISWQVGTQIRIMKANFNCKIQMLVRKCFPETHLSNNWLIYLFIYLSISIYLFIYNNNINNDNTTDNDNVFLLGLGTFSKQNYPQLTHTFVCAQWGVGHFLK